MLDPTGVVVEKWLLDGTMLTNVGFGDLAMDDVLLLKLQQHLDLIELFYFSKI
jgi:hypothetical protein